MPGPNAAASPLRRGQSDRKFAPTACRAPRRTLSVWESGRGPLISERAIVHTRSSITYRSMAIALLFMPMNAVYLVLTEVLWLTSAPTAVSLFCNVVFVLFFLVLLNLAVKKIKPDWALQPGEFFVIYTMLSLSSALCSIDMIDILVPTLSHLTYFQPIEKRYEAVLPHVPKWLLVNDPAAAASYYVGQESIYDIALLRPWLRPLFIWFWFVLALFAVMGGLNLLFRKPWTQHEKLSYPVIQVPLLLVNETERLLRNRLFWVGFGTVAFLDVLNGLHHFYPLLPHIPVVHIVNIQDFFPERPWRDMGWTMVSFYPFAIALCFFMPLDLAFSCWFFYVLFKLQRVAVSYFGIHGMPGLPYVEEQTCGGYYALALIALWMTRRHLLRTMRLALGASVDAQEPGERREARLAALLIFVGGAFLIGFSIFHDMTPWIMCFFFVSYFLISVAVTRMRAELGYPSHDLHNIAPGFQVVKFLGAPRMAKEHPRDLAMFGFYNFITRAYRAHPMPHGLEALRIAERMKMDHMRYMLAMGVAVVAGTITAFWAVLWVFTKYGGSNISGVGEWFGREIWMHVDRWFTAPEPHQPYPTYAILVGLLFSLGLAALRMNLLWWPFHPVGYAVSGSWSMEQLWMCFMTAWLIKLVLLRYGGARAYRPAVPLFVGIMLGDFLIGTFWTIYGVVTEQNVYHFWPY